MRAEASYQFRKLKRESHKPWGFNATRLKSYLSMIAQRIKLENSKFVAMEKRNRKEVSLLLQNGNEEKARIRAEAIARARNFNFVLDVVELFCSLVLQRFAMVTADKECPYDLQEAVATLMYCTGRVPVPELKQVKEQFQKKYGKHAEENLHSFVNQKVVEKLNPLGVSADQVIQVLTDIASEHNVDWSPHHEDQVTSNSSMGDMGKELFRNSFSEEDVPPPMPPSTNVQPTSAAPPPPPASNVVEEDDLLKRFRRLSSNKSMHSTASARASNTLPPPAPTSQPNVNSDDDDDGDSGGYPEHHSPPPSSGVNFEDLSARFNNLKAGASTSKPPPSEADLSARFANLAGHAAPAASQTTTGTDKGAVPSFDELTARFSALKQ